MRKHNGTYEEINHGLVVGMDLKHFPGLPDLALQRHRHFSSEAKTSEKKTHTDLAYKKYLCEHWKVIKKEH